MRTLVAKLLSLTLVIGGASLFAQAEIARSLPPAATPLPAESQTAGETRFSFLVYGDTRSRHDGIYLQPDHLMVVEGMLDTIKGLQASGYPVRFVLSSGDGVVNGREVVQWNKSFVDVVSRLIRDGNVPYFMAPGNHDVTSGLTVDAPGRAEG